MQVKFAVAFDETISKYAVHTFDNTPVFFERSKSDALASLEELATSEDLVVLHVTNKRASPATFGTTLIAVAIATML